jgi:hypothetical protein
MALVACSTSTAQYRRIHSELAGLDCEIVPPSSEPSSANAGIDPSHRRAGLTDLDRVPARAGAHDPACDFHLDGHRPAPRSLRPLPRPEAELHHVVQRRDRLSGLPHEYQQVAGRVGRIWHPRGEKPCSLITTGAPYNPGCPTPTGAPSPAGPPATTLDAPTPPLAAAPRSPDSPHDRQQRPGSVHLVRRSEPIAEIWNRTGCGGHQTANCGHHRQPAGSGTTVGQARTTIQR